MFVSAHVTFLTNLSQEPTLCALLGPRTVWQIARAQLVLLVLNRGPVSPFSQAWCPPDAFSRVLGQDPLLPTPEHLHYGAMASLPASWLDSTMASCLENVVSGGCWWPGKAAYTRACSFPPCTSRACYCFAVRWGSGCLSAVPAEKLRLQRLGHFHYNPLPLRRPSSACVGMTHLAFVLGKSLSLIKRHWLKTSQGHFQPLPR